MSTLDARDWLMFGTTILVWAFTFGAVWSKLNSKIDENAKVIDTKASEQDLNGFGDRVASLETRGATRDGRMDRFEKELSEYRRDATDSSNATVRVEKSVDDLRAEIHQNHIQAGTQLDDIKTILQENDKKTSNRLVRLETVTALEKKIGPIPED